jgi:poly-beta-1,6-N-acetyl-D-glucosamine biosynthesis protein PgaD
MTADRPWPPVIEFGRASSWVRIRDILLTTAAWARLLYLMRAGLRLIVDYFSYPVFELTGTHSPDWLEVWNRMSNFLILSVVAMLWLALWGLIHRRRLQLAAYATPPSSLPLDRHAASLNLAAGDIEEWRKLKVAVVQFDGNHRITSVAASASAA